MTPSSSSLLVCVRMASCFSAEWEAVARRLPLRSIDFDNHWVDLCGQGPDRCREDVDQFSTTAHGHDLNWLHSVGTHFEWICSPIDVIVVRDRVQKLAFINEGRLINRCEVCKRIGMGSPTSFLRDMRAIRPPHRQREKSVVILCATNGVYVT